MKTTNIMEKNYITRMGININVIDKDTHLYLGYLGNKGAYEVFETIARWCDDANAPKWQKDMVDRFVELNRDNKLFKDWLNKVCKY